MSVQVTLVYSPAPRHVREWKLQLPDGSTLRDAVAASGLAQDFPEIDLSTAQVGVWNRKAAWQFVLRDGDRVEVYRDLTADPKVARRERFRKQGARAAGLFAGKKKPGGKPGY